MEPQDDILTEDQYIQLEKFLMGESKDFRLPELPHSNRTQANNPAALQHGQSGEDATRTPRQWCNSSADDDGPPGFSDSMAQRRSNGSVLPSRTSYIVRAPDAIQPVQWSSPAVQPANTGSPKPSSPASTSTLLVDQYNNPTQPQVNTSSAATQPAQLTNLRPPATFNSNLQEAPINNVDLPPSNNVTYVQQQAWSNSEGQRSVNPQPQVAIDHNAAGSSIASRFAAASQGVSMSNPRAHSSQYDPLGFVAFARPNVTDLFSQHCAFVNGVQMDGAGYGAQASLPPQVAAAKGGQGTAILPMYSSSTFRDLAVMAQRNNNLARQKQQESPAVRNPRGRPRGPRKRQPPPQWEEAEYELEHARNKQPYNVRRAQWQDMKLSGALPGWAPMSSSPGVMATMSFDGGQGWGPDYSRMNFSNHEINQGQNGNLPHGGKQNLSFSRVENMPAEVAANVTHHQPSAQFGNVSSEVLPVETSQCNNVTLYGDALYSGVLLADENPNKFWSFGSCNNPPSTMPSLPSQNNANNNETAAVSKGKQPIEDHSNLLQSGTEISEVPVQADADQIMGEIEGMPNSFPNSGDYESMIIEPVAEAGNQFWNGHMQSTYIDFENSCVGLATQEEAPAVSAQGNNISSCNKQPTGIVAETNNNLSMNLTSFTESQVSDQFIPISVTDYLVDYEPMQLTDEDLIACALTEPFQTPQATNNDAQPNDKPATFISHSIQSGAEQPTTQEATYNPQPMEEQVTTQQTQQAGTFSPVNPVQSGVAERAVIAEPTAATFCPDQNVQNGVERQVPTLGDFQTNNSSQQLAQQANSTQNECNISSNNGNNGNNSQQPSMASQPAFHNSSAQFASQVQDGSSSVHQTYMQNSTFDGNNIPAAHQGSSSQVPCNPTSHWTTRSSRRLPRNLGPTAYYYYQQQLQQQQQQGNSANGQRHYTMPPPPVQQQTYPYGRPYRAARRRRQNTQFARNSAMDFSQCAITPSMFNDMVHDGSVDSILGSELWPGLHQDVFNTMVMADASLLDPIRLQERIAQLNSGVLPLPNLLHSMSMNQHQAGSSAPAPDRMMNYGPPPETQPNPTFQQGLGVADGANNYNFTDPQMLMNKNNIPSFQNQQQQNLQGQMNANMQQVQLNLGNWSEYPAPSSSRLSEEIQQPVPANTSSTVLTFNQENVSHNPPQQHAAPPPNPQTSTNPAYNPMFGVPYAPRGPHM